MSINKLTGDEIPRPKYGKTAKFNRYVRFIDLNKYTDEILEYSEESFIRKDIVLTKDQLNNINSSGGIPLTLEELGCEKGESVLFLDIFSVSEVFRDGTDFDSQGQTIYLLKNGTSDTAFRVFPDLIESTDDTKMHPAFFSNRLKINEEDFIFFCSTDISGGGPNAYIKINLAYKIVKV